RGRQALDEVDVGLVHLAEELPGVRRQGLDVAALALGEDRVEREARLARPGQAGEHHEAVPRQVEVDATEVVLAGAAYYQTVGHGGEPPPDAGWRAEGGPRSMLGAASDRTGATAGDPANGRPAGPGGQAEDGTDVRTAAHRGPPGAVRSAPGRSAPVRDGAGRSARGRTPVFPHDLP